MARTAQQLHAKGVEFANRGRLLPAARVLTLAEPLTKDPNLRARILATHAVVLVRMGSFVDGERMCAQALSIPGIDASTSAIVAGQMGAIVEQAGRFDEANRWLSRALTVLEGGVPRANILMNRSLIGIHLRHLDDAARDAKEAADIFASSGEPPIAEAEARHNLGYIDLLRGDLVRALEEMQSARPVMATSPIGAAVNDVDRAEVLRDAGLTTEAERILARAAPVFGRHRLPFERAEAELSLARSLLTHDVLAAARSAAGAARRFRQLGNHTSLARAEAVRMRAAYSGGLYTRWGGRLAEARRTAAFEDAEEIARELDRSGFRSEAAALRMSRELWRSRHNALDQERTVIIRPPASASMEVRLLAHAVRAERAAARGRQSEARHHAARGLDSLSLWQRDFGSLDLQTSVAMHGDALVGAGLRSAVASGKPDVIFDWSERARHLLLQVVPLRPPADPAQAKDLAELRVLRMEGGTDWLANRRAVELQERARERQWRQTRSSSFEERVTIADTAAALDHDTALICYVYSGRELLAVVITDQRAVVNRIDGWQQVQRLLPGLRADLDMAASVRTGPLADVVRRSLEERLATLSGALLDESARVAGTRRLVITVPGVLNGIPWATLPGMRGRAFTLAASATRWVRLRASVGTVDGLTRSGFAVGPRVARGSEEVEAAATAWNTPMILPSASVDDVTSLATRVDVLHIAAHGRHAVDNPMFSGLELADGALFGYDIDRITRVPETVVLSACEAGRSSVRWGEEAVGMRRIWLHAGTRSVVAAPVVVADDDACELLAAMHAGLAAGRPPAEALADATESTGIVAPFQTHGAGF